MDEHDERPINWYWGTPGADPLPADEGIKARQGALAESWWGGRWVRALRQLISGARLERGIAYARRGQVVQLDVGVGLVLARVQGTQSTPYRVRIEAQLLDDAAWERAIKGMASQAYYAAQLLNGEMPHDIEDLFRSLGLSLFPLSHGDLVMECTCPDPVSPCKHAAAVCLLLAERLDADPFLLFGLRGRTRQQIMDALREYRAERAMAAPGEPPQVDMAAGEDEHSLQACVEGFWQMGPQARGMQVRVAAPEVDLQLLKLLGNPAFAEQGELAERLPDVYHAVTRHALDLAYGEPRSMDDRGEEGLGGDEGD